MRPPPRDESAEHWEPCAPGDLSHFAARLDAHHRLRRGKQLIGGTVAGMIVVAACLLTVGALTRGSTAAPPIACAQCRMHFTDFQDHQAGQQPLDDQLVRQMKAHLDHCEHCRARFLAAFPGAKLGIVRPHAISHLLVAASIGR